MYIFVLNYQNVQTLRKKLNNYFVQQFIVNL